MIPAIVFSIGITHVWARGTIFARARALWPALLDCPLCAGVWISLLVQLGLSDGGAPSVAGVVTALGIACVSASGSLALYGLIRAIPVKAAPSVAVPFKRETNIQRARRRLVEFKEGNGYLP